MVFAAVHPEQFVDAFVTGSVPVQEGGEAGPLVQALATGSLRWRCGGSGWDQCQRGGVVRVVDLDGREIQRAEVVGGPTAIQADGADVLVGLADGSVVRWSPGAEPTTVGRGSERDAVVSLAVLDDGRIVSAHASGRLVLLVEDDSSATAALLGPGAVGGPVSVAGTTASLVHDGEVVDVPLDLASWVAAACDRSHVPIDAEAWRAATGIDPPDVHPCDL